MASEVIFTSGASSVGSGSSGPVSAVGGETIQPESRPQAETRRGDRERPLNVPGQSLSSYDSVYTDKPEYESFRKWSDERFTEDLTDGERGALSYYKGNGYKTLNAELRGTNTPTAMNKGFTKSLDSAFKGKTLGRDLVVYRGFSGNFDHEVGLVYQDKGFMSSSLNPNRAFGGTTLFKIHASAKANGAFIETSRVYNKKAPKGQLFHMQEHEVLFARGTHYMITGKSKVKTTYGERDAFDVVILEKG